MRYFNYQTSQSMSRVWMLFKDMGNITPDTLNSLPEYSHTLDIIKAALGGAISLSDESVKSFNLAAYEYKCRENDMNNKFKKAKEELHIVEFDNSDDDVSVGFGDVSDRTLHYYDDSYDKVANDDEFRSNLRELMHCRKKYIIENDIDIVNVLISALKGIPNAVKELKSIVSDDEKISGIVLALCENSKANSLIGVLETAMARV